MFNLGPTYREGLAATGGGCPIEAGLIGRLADNECRHGRLPGDLGLDCGCWSRPEAKPPTPEPLKPRKPPRPRRPGKPPRPRRPRKPRLSPPRAPQVAPVVVARPFREPPRRGPGGRFVQEVR